MPSPPSKDRTEAPAFVAVVQAGEQRIGRLLVVLVAGSVFAAVFTITAVFLSQAVESLAQQAQWREAVSDGGPAWPFLEAHLFGLLQTGVVISALVAGFWLAATWVHRRPARTFVTVAPRFRWRLLLLGLLLTSLLATGVIALVSIWQPSPVSPPVLRPDGLGYRGLYALGALLFGLLIASAEELFFRGLLLQQIAAFSSNLLLLIGVSSIIFSAAHFSQEPLLFGARVASGAALAWSVIRLGGLEFAIGAHAARNVMLQWWHGLPGENGALLSGLVLHLATSLGIVLVAEHLARRAERGVTRFRA